MSISVDDSSAHHGQTTPTGRIPQNDETVTGALRGFTRDAANSRADPEFITALRRGIPGLTYSVTVDGTLVRFTLARPGGGPCDAVRERASWQELRDALATAASTGIHPGLPAELATATWTRNGQRIHAYRPGTTPTLRRARAAMHRRLAALSPIPAIAAFGQNLVGGVTAAGLVVAPLAPVPSSPAWPPISLPITATPESLAEMPQWIVASTPGAGPSAARKAPTSRHPSTAPSASTSPDTVPSQAATRAPAIDLPNSPLPEADTSPAPTAETPTTAASPAPATEPTTGTQPTPTPEITPTLRKILRPRPHPRPHPRKKHHRRHLLPEFLRPR